MWSSPIYHKNSFRMLFTIIIRSKAFHANSNEFSTRNLSHLILLNSVATHPPPPPSRNKLKCLKQSLSLFTKSGIRRERKGLENYSYMRKIFNLKSHSRSKIIPTMHGVGFFSNAYISKWLDKYSKILLPFPSHTLLLSFLRDTLTYTMKKPWKCCENIEQIHYSQAKAHRFIHVSKNVYNFQPAS